MKWDYKHEHLSGLVNILWCGYTGMIECATYVCNLFCNKKQDTKKMFGTKKIGQIFACDLSFQTLSGTFRKAEIPWLLQYTELYATFRFWHPLVTEIK